MPGRRKLVIGALIVTISVTLAWICFAWFGTHILSFPCEDPTGNLSCEQVANRAFALYVAPPLALTAMLAWLSLRKREQ